jgi:hypothetical protein
MKIEIDQRSDCSAYIRVGDITIYVENSNYAPEFIDIWRGDKETLFNTYKCEENQNDTA